MGGWRSDLKLSSQLFLDLVWPTIGRKCGGGEIRPVEVLDDLSIARQLDVVAGIDVWQHVLNEGVRGIASRVQWGDSAVDRSGQPWNTFTVRIGRESGVATELDKRLAAIRNDRWIYPQLTVQAYCSETSEPDLLSCAVIRTKDLLEYIDANRGRLQTKPARDRETGRWATFVCVGWGELSDRVSQWRGPDLRQSNGKPEGMLDDQLGLFG